MFNRHSWISSTIFYAALLLLPILLYVFFYQGSRIDEATARNFRSLGAAADRIEQALDTFHNYSKNYSLGIDSTLLTNINNACKGSEVTWLGKSKELLGVIKKAKDQSAIKDKKLTIKAVRRRPWPYIAECRIGQFKDDIKECKQGVRFGQGKLTSHDCRGLREREPRVYNALKPTKDDEGDEVKDDEGDDGRALIEILDRFGMEVSMDTKKAFQKPTQHLSVFFDNYFIANENGDVVFANEHSSVSHDEHRRHRAGVPFASLSSIKDLLFDTPPSPLAFFGSTGEANAHLNTVPTPTGHSTVRHVQVDDIDLSVFIHPFTAGSSKLYVVGAVLSSSLADEAIRLRLGPAVDATLAIALLLTLFPVIRFWTAGDRSIFRRLNLYSVGASVLGASALSTALLSAVFSKSVDGQALDLHLKQIGNTVVRKFEKQFAVVDDRLRADFLEMGNVDEGRWRSCTEDAAENSIGKQIFCPSICPSVDPLVSELWWPAANPLGLGPSGSRRASSHWWPTSSYVLNSDGKRTVCTQYRHDLPLGLDLRFREYFTMAKNGTVDLYRIDSVVRGRQQIVASLADGNQNDPDRRVAVAIPRLLSIDGTVLPPPFQYAVFDQLGNTIFHSDEERINVSNFVDDTGNDARIRAAISYEDGETLNLDYDGISIRAYVRRLHEDVDWTLVVFRSHSLVDRISALAISLSIMLWLLTTLIIFLLCALLFFVPRPHGRDLLPAVISSSTSIPIGVAGVILGVIGLAVSQSGRGSALVVVGLLWPVAVAVVVYVFAWRRLNRKNEAHTTPCESTRPMRYRGFRWWIKEIRRIWKSMLDSEEEEKAVWIRVFALTSAILSFSVIPMLSWHAYFRTELSDGLAAHLLIEVEDAVQKKEEDYDEYVGDLIDRVPRPSLWSFLEDGVVGFRPYRKRELHDFLAKDEGESERAPAVGAGGSIWFGRLWPLLAYSPVTQQAMWHRSKGSVSERIRSVSDAVDHVTGHSLDGDVLSVKILRWIVIVLGVALVLFGCYSLVRTKFGYGRCIGRLRSLSIGKDVISVSEPARLLLVKWSDRDVRRMLEELAKSFAVKSLRWDRARIVWNDVGGRNDTSDVCSEDRTPVFVVEDFRDATAGERGPKLAATLATMVVGERSIVLCSDVMPLYHLAPGALEQDGTVRLDWGDEWRELMINFDARVLSCCDTVLDRARERTWLGIRAIDKTLEDELKANADFETVLLDIARRLRRSTLDSGSGKWSTFVAARARNRVVDWFLRLRRWRTISELRKRVLRDFRAAAQGRFKTLWAVSSFDERAQLYALAHGGSPNMRQRAAISSLVARGLITDQDPMRLCSEAFGQFIVEDLDDSLDEWRRKGQGDWWRVTWFPLVLLAGLGLLFFVNSNPETIGVIAAIGAAFVGLVPAITSVFRTGQFVQPTFSSNDE